jgi:GNAT superfamily N-acetyltransferase
MTQTSAGLPAGLRLSLETAPSQEIRGALGQAIDAHHARTVPRDSQRFALVVHDEAGQLAAGLCFVLAWQWMFVEALWVGDAWRGRGIGAALLLRAEQQAAAAGCHSAWLDTFQARDFYLRFGYEPFGALEDYPPGQTRFFLRKRLFAASDP